MVEDLSEEEKIEAKHNAEKLKKAQKELNKLKLAHDGDSPVVEQIGEVFKEAVGNCGMLVVISDFRRTSLASFQRTLPI